MPQYILLRLEMSVWKFLYVSSCRFIYLFKFSRRPPTHHDESTVMQQLTNYVTIMPTAVKYHRLQNRIKHTAPNQPSIFPEVYFKYIWVKKKSHANLTARIGDVSNVRETYVVMFKLVHHRIYRVRKKLQAVPADFNSYSNATVRDKMKRILLKCST